MYTNASRANGALVLCKYPNLSVADIDRLACNECLVKGQSNRSGVGGAGLHNGRQGINVLSIQTALKYDRSIGHRKEA